MAEPHPLKDFRVTHFRNLGTTIANQYADALDANGGRFLEGGPLARAVDREVKKLRISESGVARLGHLNGSFKISG